MVHNRPKDIAIIVIVLVIASGIYGLFLLIGQPTLGGIFAIISFCGLLSLSCFVPNIFKKKKVSKIPKLKSIQPSFICSNCGATFINNPNICPNCKAPVEKL